MWWGFGDFSGDRTVTLSQIAGEFDHVFILLSILGEIIRVRGQSFLVRHSGSAGRFLVTRCHTKASENMEEFPRHRWKLASSL